MISYFRIKKIHSGLGSYNFINNGAAEYLEVGLNTLKGERLIGRYVHSRDDFLGHAKIISIYFLTAKNLLYVLQHPAFNKNVFFSKDDFGKSGEIIDSIISSIEKEIKIIDPNLIYENYTVKSETGFEKFSWRKRPFKGSFSEKSAKLYLLKFK